MILFSLEWSSINVLFVPDVQKFCLMFIWIQGLSKQLLHHHGMQQQIWKCVKKKYPWHVFYHMGLINRLKFWLFCLSVAVRRLYFPPWAQSWIQKCSLCIPLCSSWPVRVSSCWFQVSPEHFFGEPDMKQYVYLQAQFPDRLLERVVLLSFQSGYIFIQTDKTLYTPKSVGKFNNLTLISYHVVLWNNATKTGWDINVDIFFTHIYLIRSTTEY